MIKIKLNADVLNKSLQTVISVVEKRQTLPILSHVLIEVEDKNLRLTTTDMEIEIKTAHKIKAAEAVSFTIYAKDLMDIVRRLDPKTEIEFQIEKKTIRLNIKGNTFKLNTFSHRDFPFLGKDDEIDTLEIDRQTLHDVLEKTAFSMGHQDVRNYLNGLYFEATKEKLIFATTDGHRLSVGKIDNQNRESVKQSIIIPRKTINEMTKTLARQSEKNVALELSKNFFRLKIGETEITSRLIDGKFPNYHQVIPEAAETPIKIHRGAFLENLHQASIFVDERTDGVRLVFKNNQLTLSSHSERGDAQMHFAIENCDREIEIGFNIQYLISILEKLQTKEVHLTIPESENSACLLTNTDDTTYQYVVMPMKI